MKGWTTRPVSGARLFAAAALLLVGAARGGRAGDGGDGGDGGGGGGGAPERDAAGRNEFVATVNGEPVTRAELVDELLVRHGKAVLEDLIRQRAIEQEMARAKITVAEYEVDAEIERQGRTFALDGRSLERMVAEKKNMSMEGYRVLVRRWLLIRKLIVKRENPTETDVMRWFYKNRERLYDTPAQMTVRHLLVARVDPRTRRQRTEAETKRRIAEVRQRLVRGGDFGRIARRYTDDFVTQDENGKAVTRPQVELGTMNENWALARLERPFVEAMMMLKAGQSGGPVETRKGFHFIEVTARKESRRAEYEKFRAVARADYLEHRAQLNRDVFLRNLMERTRVTRSLEQPERERLGATEPPVFRGTEE